MGADGWICEKCDAFVSYNQEQHHCPKLCEEEKQTDQEKIKSLAVVLRTLAKAALELTDELTKKRG